MKTCVRDQRNSKKNIWFKNKTKLFYRQFHCHADYVNKVPFVSYIPFNALSKFSAPLNPSTLAGVSMCDKSAATPGVCTISYKLK